jgi:hypothetical protein
MGAAAAACEADCGAGGLFDEAEDSAAAAAALARVPRSKRDYADARFWRRRYAADAPLAAADAAAYDWRVASACARMRVCVRRC